MLYYIFSTYLITGHLYILTTFIQFLLYLLFETEREECFCIQTKSDDAFSGTLTAQVKALLKSSASRAIARLTSLPPGRFPLQRCLEISLTLCSPENFLMA